MKATCKVPGPGPDRLSLPTGEPLSSPKHRALQREGNTSENRLTVTGCLLCAKHCSKDAPQIIFLCHDPTQARAVTREKLRHRGCTDRSHSSEAFQLAAAERRCKPRPVAAQGSGEEPYNSRAQRKQEEKPDPIT